MKISDAQVLYGLRDFLLQDERLAELVGEKISPVIIPGETKGDSVFYGSYNLKSDSTKHGLYSYSMRVAYGVVSSDFDRMNEIAWRIVERLTSRMPFNLQISLEDKEEAWEDGKYKKVIEFSVSW